MEEEVVEITYLDNEHELIQSIGTIDTFDKIKSEVGSKLLIIHFTSASSPYCKKMKPHLEQMAKDFEGQAVFVKIDVVHKKELGEHIGFKSVPSFKLIKGGHVVHELEGGAACSHENLLQIINSHL